VIRRSAALLEESANGSPRGRDVGLDEDADWHDADDVPGVAEYAVPRLGHYSDKVVPDDELGELGLGES
jgi:hypothetical protein